MTPETRNSKVVAALVLCMTVGAGLLLWLEPRTRGWSGGALLMAERAERVENVLIEFIPAGRPLNRADYDCLIMPDGQCFWQPRGPKVRLALFGATDGHLSEPAARSLLAVLGRMNQVHGLDLRQVRLDPDSDARRRPDLPPSAHQLADLLARKGLLD